LALQKAKDIYLQKGGELDKLRKDNASAKEIEKAEVKLKKAQDDYKVLVEKYSNVKEEFEKKMNIACKVHYTFLFFLNIIIIVSYTNLIN
jgi:F-BAR domain only protein